MRLQVVTWAPFALEEAKGRAGHLGAGKRRRRHRTYTSADTPFPSPHSTVSCPHLCSDLSRLGRPGAVCQASLGRVCWYMVVAYQADEDGGPRMCVLT